MIHFLLPSGIPRNDQIEGMETSLKLTVSTHLKNGWGWKFEDIVSYSGPQPRWRVVSGRVSVSGEAKFNHLVIQSDLFGMVK